MKETPVQQRVRIEGGRLNRMLWRNNVGVLQDATGRPVRYGLANDTPEINRVLKSSDLIGIDPVLIGPEHVGQVMGRFLAVETKHAGWHMTPSDAHAQAQLAYHDLVRQYGGVAGFATSVEDFWAILNGRILRG